VVEARTALDHERLDTTLGPESEQGSLQVDSTGVVRRRPHHRREVTQPLDEPPGSGIGEQDQDLLSSLDDEVFLQRYVARAGDDDGQGLWRTFRLVEA